MHSMGVIFSMALLTFIFSFNYPDGTIQLRPGIKRGIILDGPDSYLQAEFINAINELTQGYT